MAFAMIQLLAIVYMTFTLYQPKQPERKHRHRARQQKYPNQAPGSDVEPPVTPPPEETAAAKTARAISRAANLAQAAGGPLSESEPDPDQARDIAIKAAQTKQYSETTETETDNPVDAAEFDQQFGLDQ